jgi:phytoene dehydrogenase-like protein
MTGARTTRYDALVVGGGHNGLVAATLLAQAGRSVLVLERRDELGGAAVSHAPFPGVDVSVSQFSYLVSLWPAELSRLLGIRTELRRRPFGAYAPDRDRGVLIGPDAERTARMMADATGDDRAFAVWRRFHERLERLAGRVFPTLLEPLRSRADLRRLIDDEDAWTAVFEEPLSETLRGSFASGLLRGVVATDALIGTFASLDDPQLRQNRCFLYHVIGNGTGRWDVPVGGMGALSHQLATAARAAGAELRTRSEVVSVASDGTTAEVSCADGKRFQGRHVLAGVAPAALDRLMGEGTAADPVEGAQLKINLLLSRLPRLRDKTVTPEEAFAGTFHVNESYEELQSAYEQAVQGEIPEHPPADVYCHSLTDPTILSAELRSGGAQTMSVFALHMPARLFAQRPEERRDEAVAATLRSLNSVLAEPIEGCLWQDAEGRPCLEAISPADLERELAMPGGHIFHRDLSWPFAESEDEVGRWGVETGCPNVWLCGAGARRGGGVSGIPGHNAARAVLAQR